ncbi:MAG: fluoride efflux transporter CrcB [Flavipsychrobacter sp.]|nr:fluoride efflux transporter CrcB [Flavipsychrobacter sp.]
MLRALLLVGLGGAIGSMARYGVSRIINARYTQSFPLATFIINIVGCLLIGLLFGYVQKNSNQQSDLWLALATGFCGGFTTFSAFALENVTLLKGQLNITALLYIAASVIVGILLCRLGISITS